ncbi:hypothetical protein E3E29_11075 [Thermococcus sp. Bubb.Bath]|nr:hypothetical protein [Thermococcus sp. Bubb.Bath]
MKMTFILAALVLGALLIVGSSGNFRKYESTRGIMVSIVPHDQEYMGFGCEDGYAATVVVDRFSAGYFSAINVTNNLPTDSEVQVALYPDYSGLPVQLGVLIESDTGLPVTLSPGESHEFMGYYMAGCVAPGEYVIPMTMYATWEGGGASISTCPVRLIVRGIPTIKKVLLSGNTTGIPLKTYQEWVFQIVVTNPTNEDLNLTITDTIPAEFNVSLLGTGASAGTYRFWPANAGGCHHGCGGGHGTSPATKMEWNVTVPAGGSEHMNVTIFTRVNGGGQQEFTSCGPHPLNDGAEIKGYGIVSNGLWVSVACGGCCGNCGCGGDGD